MKKGRLLFSLFATFLLSGCSVSDKETKPVDSEEVTLSIYKQYQKNGGTLSYEAWLSSIKGEKGDDGQTPYIGSNGHWYIGYEDTGVLANGITPHIGQNGNWFLGNTDTTVKALGKDGQTPYIGENGNWWIGEVDTFVNAIGTENEIATKVLTGAGVPSESLGFENNLYIDVLTLDVYTKMNDSWHLIDSMKELQLVDGTDIELRVNGDLIQWRLKDSEEWTTLFNKNSFLDDADVNEKIQLRVFNGFLQWKQVTESDWSDLINLGNMSFSHKMCTVIYDVNGGVMPNDSPYSTQVRYGDTLNLPIPTRESYSFEGWFFGEGVNAGQVTLVTPITKNLVLKAKWEEVSTDPGIQKYKYYNIVGNDDWKFSSYSVNSGKNTFTYKVASVEGYPIAYTPYVYTYRGENKDIKFNIGNDVGKIILDNISNSVEKLADKIKTVEIKDSVYADIKAKTDDLSVQNEHYYVLDSSYARAMYSATSLLSYYKSCVPDYFLKDGAFTKFIATAYQRGTMFRLVLRTKVDYYLRILHNTVNNTFESQLFAVLDSNYQMTGMIETANIDDTWPSDLAKYNDEIQLVANKSQLVSDGVTYNNEIITGSKSFSVSDKITEVCLSFDDRTNPISELALIRLGKTTVKFVITYRSVKETITADFIISTKFGSSQSYKLHLSDQAGTITSSGDDSSSNVTQSLTSFVNNPYYVRIEAYGGSLDGNVTFSIN